MARIRTIKPEFWASGQIIDCSVTARLLFIGIWNFADDHGVVPNKPRDLKARIFPADDITSETVRGMLSELVENGLLYPFRAEGEEFLVVTGWKHQRIDKPSYKYPAPPGEAERKTGQLSLAIRLPFEDQYPAERKGKDSKGEEQEGNRPLAERSPVDDDDPGAAQGKQIREVIAAFDQERVRVFGEMQARAYPQQNDATDARKYLTDGATVIMCRDVFAAGMDRMKAQGRPPPGGLRYFRDSIAEMIAGGKAPAPAGRNGSNGKHTDDSPPVQSAEDRLDLMKKRAEAICKGAYVPNVTMQDVEGMVKQGWLSWEQAEKAGYNR